jgi:hypothetical protein
VTKLNDSRILISLDVPEPLNLRASFIYNFFVRNEKTDRSGNMKHNGPSHLLNNKSKDPTRFDEIAVTSSSTGIRRRAYDVKLPRSIEVSFDKTLLRLDGKGFDIPKNILFRLQTEDPIKVIDELANLEENVTSLKDVIIKMNDGSINERLQSKINLAIALLGIVDQEESAQIFKLLEEEKFDQNVLDYLIGQDSQQNVSYVNAQQTMKETQAFSTTKRAVVDAAMDIRFLRELNSSFVNRTDFNKLKNDFNYGRLESVAQSLSNDDSQDDAETSIKSFNPIKTGTNDSRLVFDAKVIGYLVYKNEITADGSEMPVKKFFLPDFDSKDVIPRFEDRQVVYGSTYVYNVRSVILTKRLHSSTGNDELELGYYEIYSTLVSRESESVSIQAIEDVPPGEPDSIFYDYIYGQGGLRISWRMPTNRQRDIKYIQVFRRRTIFEPFQCIAELDFDDSEIKFPKTELIETSRIIKLPRAQTNYVDQEFETKSSYIYALAAIDAHGMTSGYSRQMQVSFNRIENQLVMKAVSEKGAPKQYPNFYIDPSMDDNVFVNSMTVDSMRLSGAKKLKVFFDPDAVTYSSSNGKSGFIVRDQKQDAVYKIHMINLDRQKDQIMTLKAFTSGD